MKSSKGSQKKSATTPPPGNDPSLEDDLRQPSLAPLTERLSSVAQEAAAARSQEGIVVPRGQGRRKPKAPALAVPETELPFTVSGCRSILYVLLSMLSRWALAPNLLDDGRLNEGAKLHAEVLNRRMPERWKDSADLVMLGGWWLGITLDCGLSKLLTSTEPESRPAPVPPPPSVLRPRQGEVTADGNRKPYEPPPGQAISG